MPLDGHTWRADIGGGGGGRDQYECTKRKKGGDNGNWGVGCHNF